MQNSYRRTLLGLIPPKLYLGFLAALTTQQCIVASSTVWIALLSESVVLKKPILGYLSLFVASLTLVYIPAILMTILNKQLLFVSFWHYLEKFYQHFLGHIQYRNNAEVKQDYFPILTSEAFSVLQEAYLFQQEVLSLLLNVGFNLLAISIILRFDFAISYFIGFGLAYGFILWSKRRIEALAEKDQSARVKTQSHLLSGWDTITIGNSPNSKPWFETLKELWNTQKSSGVHAIGTNHIIGAISMLLVLVPVSYTFFRFALLTKSEPVQLAVLVATLPRQVQMVQFIHELTSYFTLWSALKIRLIGILKPLLIEPPQKFGLLERIEWEKLNWNNGSSPQNIEECIQMIQSLGASGYLQLQGPNGAGKSSVLQYLKKHFGDQAFYLPAQHDLFFPDIKAGSTGERTVAILNQILKDFPQKILLLDEWSANLSQQNIEKLEAILEATSKKRLLIEVRHYAGSGS